MKIVFFGGHELGKSALELIYQAGYEVVLVTVSDNKDKWYSGVDEIALKYALPLKITNNINDDEFVESVRALKADLIVVANFEQILKSSILSTTQFGAINAHASLLPRYRGRAPLNWAIINGETEVGISVHFVELGIDTGDILVQKAIKVEEDEFIDSILYRVQLNYAPTILEAVKLIDKNQLKAIKQDESLASYFGKRTPEQGQIDWSQSGRTIYNFIRALSRPYPGAFGFLDGSKLIIWRCRYISLANGNEDSGRILKVKEGEITVKVNEGVLVLTDYDFETFKIEKDFIGRKIC